MNRRAVIKIGSGSLLYDEGYINKLFLRKLVDVIAEFKVRQWSPLLVLSGAVDIEQITIVYERD